MSFNPNDYAAPNGNIFGFPYSADEAEIILVPVPWEVTTSYGTGTVYGPQRILEESTQLDFIDPLNEKGWETSVHVLPVPENLFDNSHKLRKDFELYEESLEKGNQPTNEAFNRIEQGCQHMIESVEKQSAEWLNKGKKVGIVGGDHSSPLGLINQLGKRESFGVLQIDAHADLRKAYMGFTHSHASIMHNVLENPKVEKLVQVGVRDLCPDERNRIESDPRISCFFDWELSGKKLSGVPFRSIADRIIDALPDRVYISFDVDGMDPSLCPNTGTPVPGGLQWGEVNMLFQLLQQSGKEVIGFDLCETGNGRADGNISARLLFKLIQLL